MFQLDESEVQATKKLPICLQIDVKLCFTVIHLTLTETFSCYTNVWKAIFVGGGVNRPASIQFTKRTLAMMFPLS